MREPALPDGVPQPLDNELLAWAAGFFDGEGTTIARTDSRRLDYLQLDVSVPQVGRQGVPTVLTKFQRAMLGVGAIYREKDDLHKWRAGGRVSAEMSLALMWPWLGTIKRTQAAVALDAVLRQYADGRRKVRAARYRPTLVGHATPAPTDEARLECAWAAGFLDAEGYFGIPRRNERADGSIGLSIRASATQHGSPNVPAGVLLRLQRTLGGRIERHGEIDDFKWVTEGGKNVGVVLERLRPWLGEVKLLQGRAALDAHEASRVRGGPERCARGHLYDGVYIRSNGNLHQRCSACDRIRDNEKRASLGRKRRRLRNPSEDPTRAYRFS